MDADDREFLEGLSSLRFRLRTPGNLTPERGRLTSAMGGRIDFHSHRRYERRDPPRVLDWRVFARTGVLVAKDFVDERSLDFHVLLDTSGSMGLGSPSKLWTAARVAIGVCYLALHSGATVSVWKTVASPASHTSRVVEPIVRRVFGRQRFRTIWHLLSQQEATGSLVLHPILNHWSRALPTQCEAMVISDFLCPTLTPESFAHLGGGRHVALMQVLSAQDSNPELPETVLLEDSETGQTRLYEIRTPEKRAYAERLARSTAVARGWCEHNHQRWLSHDPATAPLERIRAFALGGSRTLRS